MTDPDQGTDDERRTALLLEQMVRKPTAICAKCGDDLCAHQVVIAHAMGFKDRMTCAACIARGLGKPKSDFLEHVLKHIQHRECFHQAWQWASRFHGFGEEQRPRSLFPRIDKTEETETIDRDTRKLPLGSRATGSLVDAEAVLDSPSPEAVWDAGDMGCGDLVLELRTRLKAMTSGALLQVRATDPGAPEDIPAWCGMTGHGLVAKSHPVYLIRRREAP